MTKLEDIEKAVLQLNPEDLARFKAWFDEHQERLFDERIEQDVRAGKLDWLVDEALLILLGLKRQECRQNSPIHRPCVPHS